MAQLQLHTEVAGVAQEQAHPQRAVREAVDQEVTTEQLKQETEPTGLAGEQVAEVHPVGRLKMEEKVVTAL